MERTAFQQVAFVACCLCHVPLCNPPWCGGSFKRTRSRRYVPPVPTCHPVVKGQSRACESWEQYLGYCGPRGTLPLLTEQAKAAEYHGNVKVLHKLTREAAGQPRIKPIPSITMEDNTTLTMGPAQTNERWRQCFAKFVQGRVTTLADASNVQDHACRTSAFPTVRCAQRSCARKVERVQVSTTFLWNSSKLVETRWFPFFVLTFTESSSKAAFPFGFKALGCVHFGRARLTHAVVRTIVASRSAT